MHAHEDFVARWAAFWAAPDPARTGELSAPGIVLHWPGRPEPLRGIEAWSAQVAAALDRLPDLRLAVVDHAAGRDGCFIAWRASATVAGRRLEWEGVDRMALSDGLVTASTVVFDTAVLRPPAAG
ncbi:nuclear transport factor 2 family protein [Kitasatospora sp. NPDC059571]|uniref:nuclear transport factor 2 family protein n=1 Tax=Kitasatospora sp. NPDC059571 TaxID=3346871 RepID=UPI0036AD9628